MNRIESILNNIEPLRQDLLNHEIYKYIETPDDLRTFTQHHIFAVWDFMSLAKSLQQKLTNVNVPWTPKRHPEFTFLINDIILSEESDLNKNGQRQSHFDMYLQAMHDLGAPTQQIETFIEHVEHGTDIFLVISASDLPKTVKTFLIFTFNTIYNKGLHQIASAFTFGREELIPDLFTEVINQIEQKFPNEDVSNLKYYFERHIEIDGNKHGPMAIKLINSLCEEDDLKWQEAEKIAGKALKKRIKLWDGILKNIMIQKAIA